MSCILMSKHSFLKEGKRRDEDRKEKKEEKRTEMKRKEKKSIRIHIFRCKNP